MLFAKQGSQAALPQVTLLRCQISPCLVEICAWLVGLATLSLLLLPYCSADPTALHEGNQHNQNPAMSPHSGVAKTSLA